MVILPSCIIPHFQYRRLGTVFKGLIKELGDSEMRRQVEIFQTTAL